MDAKSEADMESKQRIADRAPEGHYRASSTVRTGPHASLGAGARELVFAASDHEKHYVSLDLRNTGSQANALRLYEEALDSLAAAGVSIVYERIFGPLSVRSAMEDRRRATYTRIGARLPPMSYLEGLPSENVLAGAIVYGIKPLAGGPVTISPAADDGEGSAHGSVVVTPRARQLHLSEVTDGDGEGRSAAWRFARAFERLGNLIERNGFHPQDIVRTWIYLSDIRRDYVTFNEARRQFFAAHGIDFGPAAKLLPASTGIQARSSRHGLITIDAYCLDRRVSRCHTKRVYNVRQCEADGDAYRMKPTFARGMLVDDGEQRELHISGTASIDARGESVFVGRPADQIRATLQNVSSLLSAEGMSIRDICQATYHFKDAETLACFQEVSVEMGFDGIRGPRVITDICRPELLFEVDGIALCSTLP